MSTHSNSPSVIRYLQEFSIPLIAGVVGAILWINLDEASYNSVIFGDPNGYNADHPSHSNFHFFVNDIFMVFFFGIAAKEITESVLPGGSLNPISRAINPLLGTIGGVVGPVGVYLGYCFLTGNTEPNGLIKGWGIPTATDIALAWLVARMVFGKGHPAVSFLLLLAVADDAIGLGIIAVAYPSQAPNVAFIGLIAAGAIFAYILRRAGVQNYWFYLIGPGVVSWCGFFFAHLHPALALVPVVPFMPGPKVDDGLFEEHGHHDDTLNKFEHELKSFVDFGLLGFGLANAGVLLKPVGDPTVAVLVALLAGKTLGIFGFSYAGHILGFKLPEGMNGRSLLVAGVIASLGLTVALFVAGAAFPSNATLQGAAKMGALLSAVAAPLAFILGAVLKVKQAEPDEPEKKVQTHRGNHPANEPEGEVRAMNSPSDFSSPAE